MACDQHPLIIASNEDHVPAAPCRTRKQGRAVDEASSDPLRGTRFSPPLADLFRTGVPQPRLDPKLISISPFKTAHVAMTCQAHSVRDGRRQTLIEVLPKEAYFGLASTRGRACQQAG
jgi:hypothetical protein